MWFLATVISASTTAPGLGEPGSSAESTRLWAIRIRVEVATPRITEILMSHFGSWKCGARIGSRANEGMPSRLTDGIGPGRL